MLTIVLLHTVQDATQRSDMYKHSKKLQTSPTPTAPIVMDISNIAESFWLPVAQ
jgi:hypothetical protein